MGVIGFELSFAPLLFLSSNFMVRHERRALGVRTDFVCFLFLPCF